MDRKIWTGIMVLAFVVGIANGGRDLTIKEEQEQEQEQEQGDIPLPLPKEEVTSSQIPPQTANPTQVPAPLNDENVNAQKEFIFYMHHSLGVGSSGISGIGGTMGSGINGFGSGNGGGPLPLTFPIGALLNNPNNLVNGLGLGLGVGGGGSLINGANGIGVGGVGGLTGGGFTNPNLVNVNSLGGLGVGLLPTTTLNFGGLGLGKLGGANGGVVGVGGQESDHMMMLEEPITHEPEEGSHAIGKAQGYYMEIESSHEHDQDHNMLAMSFTASFHDGEYSGSLVQLAGQINMDNEEITENGSENVLQVVGGSGVFEKAKGHHALIHAISSFHQQHGLLLKISIPLSP